MQLESAATVGVIVILTVVAIIVRTSIHAGLPAIKSGELPLWTFEVTTSLFLSGMGLQQQPCMHFSHLVHPCLMHALNKW